MITLKSRGQKEFWFCFILDFLKHLVPQRGSYFRFTVKSLMGTLSFPGWGSYETNHKPLKMNTSNSGDDLEWKQNISPVEATPPISRMALLSLVFKRWKYSKRCPGPLAQSSILLSKAVPGQKNNERFHNLSFYRAHRCFRSWDGR